ncbi:MAG: RICIN domain-containing protein [Minicystis sp.]
MSTKHDSKHNIFGRLTRALAAASAAAGLLCASAPAQASTAADTALGIAGGILDSTVGFGTGTTLVSVFQSKNTTAVDLSAEAFEEIRNIVEDVVQTYTWMDYYNYVEDAEDAAILYTRDPSQTSQAVLLQYVDDAKDVINKVDQAINRMADVGMQGTPSYMMMASLQLKFLQELADVETLLGSSSSATYYMNLRATRAQEHFDYLREMWFSWEETADNMRPIVHNPTNGYCYWTGETLSTLRVWCSSSYETTRTGRDASLGGGRDAILGKYWYLYLARLSGIAGHNGTTYLSDSIFGQQIAAVGNTAKCIHKKDRGFDDGNAVHLWDCTAYGEENDSFIYEKETGYIRLADNPSACLHKSDPNWNNGNALHVWDCDDGPEENKSWDFDATTGYIKARYNKSKCIHKKYGTWDNGNPIHLWDCSAGEANNKTWKLK